MNIYGVTINIADFYFEVEADNQTDAIEKAFELAYEDISSGEIGELDCNECFLIEGEEEDEDEEDEEEE